MSITYAKVLYLKYTRRLTGNSLRGPNKWLILSGYESYHMSHMTDMTMYKLSRRRVQCFLYLITRFLFNYPNKLDKSTVKCNI